MLIFESYFKMSMLKISTYQGKDVSIEDCRIYLSQFCGGEVVLKLDDELGIATICFNNPEKKNSITGKMMVDLEEAVVKLENWKIGKGLLVYGTENNFCSGGDLNFAQKSGTTEGGYIMAKFMQNVLTRLRQLPMISVAFIEGYALGGGAELAISCDYRIFANEKSAIGFVHTKMGIIPAWGGMTTAIQTLGYRTALDLVMTARVVRTAEAQTLGLCDAVVGSVSGTRDWLVQFTQWNAEVVRAAKCVAHNTREAQTGVSSSHDVLDFEKRVFAPLWGGPANKLALSKNLKHKN